MRCFYREKRYYSGNYLEVDIYPVFGRAGQRRSRYKPTSECQKELNRRNAEKKLIRLMNANFTEDDYKIELTYRNDTLPEDDDAALKELRNFLRRLKRLRRKKGLPELKYVAATEKGTRKGRYHHHLVISGDLDIKEIRKVWARGIVHFSPLEFNEEGIEALARYHMKEPIGSKFFQASRNLTQPEIETRDAVFSQKTVNAMAKIAGDGAMWEGIYDGYTFVSAEPFYNDYNRHQYITVRMYIPPKKEKVRRC